MKMNKNDMVVFILSHGRADNLVTLNMIKSHGYTGDYKIVLDNEDESIHEYEKKFGKDNIVVFDKLAISKTFDTADNFDNRKTIVYARNACFGLAKKLGYKYFMELDDDYNAMFFRYIKGGKIVKKDVTNMDEVLNCMVEFLERGNLDMFQPSSVWVSQMGSTHFRLHHHVSWNNTVPKVINQDWKRD